MVALDLVMPGKHRTGAIVHMRPYEKNAARYCKQQHLGLLTQTMRRCVNGRARRHGPCNRRNEWQVHIASLTLTCVPMLTPPRLRVGRWNLSCVVMFARLHAGMQARSTLLHEAVATCTLAGASGALFPVASGGQSMRSRPAVLLTLTEEYSGCNLGDMMSSAIRAVPWQRSLPACTVLLSAPTACAPPGARQKRLVRTRRLSESTDTQPKVCDLTSVALHIVWQEATRTLCGFCFQSFKFLAAPSLSTFTFSSCAMVRTRRLARICHLPSRTLIECLTAACLQACCWHKRSWQPTMQLNNHLHQRQRQVSQRPVQRQQLRRATL